MIEIKELSIQKNNRKFIDALIKICRTNIYATENTSKEIYLNFKLNSKYPFFKEEEEEKDFEKVKIEIQNSEWGLI